MRNIFILSSLALLMACGGEEKKENGKEMPQESAAQKEVQAYLDNYNKEFQKLLVAVNEGQWTLQTHIVEGDTLSNYKAQQSDKAFADYTGSTENIDKAKKFLEKQEELTDLQVRQLKTILFMAGSNPKSAGDLVDKKIKATKTQVEKLFGFKYKYKGKPVTTNEIDEVLKNSGNINDRLEAWKASKEVGKTLKDGLVELQALRNEAPGVHARVIERAAKILAGWLGEDQG